MNHLIGNKDNHEHYRYISRFPRLKCTSLKERKKEWKAGKIKEGKEKNKEM